MHVPPQACLPLPSLPVTLVMHGPLLSPHPQPLLSLYSLLYSPCPQSLLKLSIKPSKGVAPEEPLSTSRGVATEMWTFPPRCYPGEPTWIPRTGPRPGPQTGAEAASVGGEEDGWLLVVVHNAGTMKGEVHIFDGARYEGRS